MKQKRSPLQKARKQKRVRRSAAGSAVRATNMPEWKPTAFQMKAVRLALEEHERTGSYDVVIEVDGRRVRLIID